MTWYEKWFDSDAYEVVYRERNLAEAERLLDLAISATGADTNSRLLDVACGRGRHARLLAARGYRVTGLDLSANAIATASARAESEGVDVEFVIGDMRDMPFMREFDGALNLFTSFGYFEQDADHQRAIDGMARALKAGGFLVQDFLNAQAAVDNLVPSDERQMDHPEIGTITLRQQRWVEHAGGAPRIKKRIELYCPARPGDEPDTFVFHESVRLFTRDDFEEMYVRAGLTVDTVFGDYEGGPHGPLSPRVILISRRST